MYKNAEDLNRSTLKYQGGRILTWVFVERLVGTTAAVESLKKK